MRKRAEKVNPEGHWFGTRAVDPDSKTGMVEGVFSSVAGKYDVMNDLMSGGLHRYWKNHFVRRIRPRAGLRYLDVAGGTGDIAFRLRQKIGAGADITVCDLTPAMLEAGRDRAIDRGWLHDFNWVEGNAENLPFPDQSFDVYTISFGLRNVARIDSALKEARRVLRPGGRFYCLEFSHIDEPMLSRLYDAYSFRVIPKLGALVAKDRESYQYLVESIRKMPRQDQLAARLKQAGFSRAGYENLHFGLVALHTAWT